MHSPAIIIGVNTNNGCGTAAVLSSILTLARKTKMPEHHLKVTLLYQIRVALESQREKVQLEEA